MLLDFLINTITKMEHVISSERFELRPVTDSDIQFIHAGLSDPKVTKYYAVHFDTLEETEEQMEWYRNIREEGSGFWWCIEDLEKGRLVGAGGYNDIDIQEAKAEIGFWVLPEFWGQGIMRICFPLIIDFGIHEMGISRIEGYVESNNSACKSALRNTDFKFERTFEEFDSRKQELLSLDLYAINV